MFYETLKEICQKKNTSPSAVCLAIGISKSNATEWKNGRSPKLDTVVEIANYLNISPSRLIPKKQKEETEAVDG
ncbi:MAG: helix-turn-helix transcriptional regulator [Bacteroidaceae bacterium]|nr:helix-turn-helix transcriptional regulator [Bacteroidaceae bacterium]MBR4930407.1 helix-turn-helix transcriptional regulator [Bacteroidaceae bacterium]